MEFMLGEYLKIVLQIDAISVQPSAVSKNMKHKAVNYSG
jgi:hypothetical protein